MGRRERKVEKRKQVWMAAILVFLMVASGFGVIIGNQSNEMKYGDFKFSIKDNRYVTEVEERELFFYNLPQQLEFINLSSTTTNKLKESYMIYMTFNPEEDPSLPYIELSRFELSQVLGKSMVNGVLVESEDYALPVLTCASATMQTPMIIFNISSETSIIDIDNCIYFNARGPEFIQLKDRLVYSYFGVIQDE